MKKIKNILSTRVALLMLAPLAMGACTGDFYDINKSTYEPGQWEIPPGVVAVNAIQTMQRWVMPVTDNPYQMDEVISAGAFCRYFGYSQDNKWATSFGKFNPSDEWLNSPFNNAFGNIYVNYTDVATIAEEDSRWMGYATILRVAAMHRMTDMYGPIPYSKINVENPTVAIDYDTQEVVYKSMLEDLNRSIDILTLTAETIQIDDFFAGYDLLHQGDIIKWIRFANSLKLRIAIRMSIVDEATAKEAAREAVQHVHGVILTNADNAALNLDKRHPLTRTVDEYGDTRAAAEIVCYMDGWGDPRLPKYFSTYAGGSSYLGLRSVTLTVEFGDGLDYSKPLTQESDPLMWINAAEVAFIMSEGVLLRGWGEFISETAESLYNKGIQLSFEQWGVTDATAYNDYINDDTSVPAPFVDAGFGDSYSPTPAWTLKVKWASSDTELQLEQIITQKWLAIYPLCNEAWAEMRRTGYPRFFPSINYSNVDGGTLAVRGPSRLPYPPQERNTNTVYYDAALQILGGSDVFGTRLWWDVKTDKPGW